MDESQLPSPDRRVAFSYGGVDVLFNERMLVNLTQMWEAAGRPENKDPRQWRRKEGAGFIKDLARTLNVPVGHIITGTRGKGGASFAHRQIAIAYAKYLSHEFHRFVNDRFIEWAEEKASPGLKLERAVSAYKQLGLSDDWIAERLEGTLQRKALTATMADHNCRRVGTDNPFAEATRSISLQVLGKTPREIKAGKGLPKSARTRDHLDKHELVRLKFAESEAERLMKQEGADGNAACVDACRRAGRAVRIAIDSLNGKAESA